MNKYDVIVVGTGGVGSAACYYLAKRGLNVLGLDRFEAGHDQGSSHGQTRIIREAYFEHPNYVPLAKRAFLLWDRLEKSSGQSLLDKTGLLTIGPDDGVLVSGVRKSADDHGLEIFEMTRNQVNRKWPTLVLPEDSVALFEQQAGILYVEKCVIAHLNLAAQAGAELKTDIEVQSWTANEDGVLVKTDKGEFYAEKLVISAGAWSKQLLEDLDISLTIKRKHLHWFATKDESFHLKKKFPVFIYETPDGYYYGVPEIEETGMKIAEHSSGTIIEDPLKDEKTTEEDDVKRVTEFVKQHFPSLSTETVDHTVCYYTLSEDEHFILDHHPKYNNVVFAAGLSGHGFKFTNVLGSAISDMIIDDKTSLPVDFLSLERLEQK